MPRASSVSLGKYRRVGSASRRNARIDDTPPPQHQRITQHHICSPYPPDRSNSGQKTHAFDTSMASPSRQHKFTVRVSHICIITAAECGRSRHRPEFGHSRRAVPWVVVLVHPSLGAPSIEFGHMTSQPCSEATRPRTTSSSTLLPIVTLFSEKTRQSTRGSVQREKRMDETLAKALSMAKPGTWGVVQSHDLW